MKMELKGEILVSMSCWLVKLDLKGQLNLSGTQTQPAGTDQPAQQMDVAGTGEIELRMRTEYTK